MASASGSSAVTPVLPPEYQAQAWPLIKFIKATSNSGVSTEVLYVLGIVERYYARPPTTRSQSKRPESTTRSRSIGPPEPPYPVEWAENRQKFIRTCVKFERLTESYRRSDEYLTKVAEISSKPADSSTSGLATELPSGSNNDFEDLEEDIDNLNTPALQRIVDRGKAEDAARAKAMAEQREQPSSGTPAEPRTERDPFQYRNNPREPTEEIPRTQPFSSIPPDQLNEMRNWFITAINAVQVHQGRPAENPAE
ncbi:hypothetical protein MMC12_003660 [Toensbergia leucococca]|nr:hypothetical protein [Toensbergia leucococca]